ncbi:hypothetical protein HMPREF1019_01480 [Campylobacter sp. 10_1_50]|nr:MULTISPECIES: hypothetical protein [Campylobacter]EHL89293.1 hypothetical protein HMPREF1019_01480 [Campylobacter sp. 10_1_50]
MFLKLDEIARKLDQILLPLEQEGMSGMRLLPRKRMLWRLCKRKRALA